MSVADQGLNQSRYMVIPRTLTFVRNQDSVLLIRGAPTKRLWANKYNGLGGHVEAGESIYSAAIREVFEESGLREIELNLVGLISIATGKNPGIVLFVFSGYSAQTKLLESSEGKLEWVKLTDIQTLPLVEDLYKLLPMVLNHDPNCGMISGLYSYTQTGDLEVKLAYP